MAVNISVEADQFALGMAEILDQIETDCDAAFLPAVKAGCRKARKVAKEGAHALFGGTGRYAEGFSSRVKKSGKLHAEGEVGNKDLPGLAHLLEKGHATLGGGRVDGREHLITAYDEGAKDFWDTFVREVDKALG